MYIYTGLHMYIYIYIYTHVHTYSYVHVYIDVYMDMYAQTYSYPHSCMYSHPRTHVSCAGCEVLHVIVCVLSMVGTVTLQLARGYWFGIQAYGLLSQRMMTLHAEPSTIVAFSEDVHTVRTECW